MSCFRKIAAYFYIALTLLFSVQAFPDIYLDQKNTTSNESKFNIQAIEYNLIASSDQRQNPEKTSNPHPTIVKYTVSDNDGLLCGLSSKNLISGYRYYSISKTIFINLTSFIIIFPFHFFG